MELFIRNDSEFQRLYNCSFYNVSDIPLELRAHFPIGALIFTLAFVQEVKHYSNFNFIEIRWKFFLF